MDTFEIVDYLDSKPPQALAFFRAGRDPADAVKALRRATHDHQAQFAKYFGWAQQHVAANVPEKCSHCGHPFRYIAVVLRRPAQRYDAMGLQCLQSLGLSADPLAIKRLKGSARSASGEPVGRKQLALARESFLAANSDFVAHLESWGALPDWLRADDYIDNGLKRLDAFGGLPDDHRDAMIEAMKERIARAQPHLQKEVLRANAPTGEATVTGNIHSVKIVQLKTGEAIKMLVFCEDGARVFGTVPQDLLRHFKDDFAGGFAAGQRAMAGASVTFSGSFRPSDDDPKFGFFSHPKLVQVIRGAT